MQSIRCSTTLHHTAEGAAVIELSGLGGFNSPVHFSTPQLIRKNYLEGVRLNALEQHSITQCILLSACIQRFPTHASFRMIRSSEATTVLWIIYLLTLIDVTLANVLFFIHLCHIHCYVYVRLYCESCEIKSSNADECYTGWHKINGTSDRLTTVTYFV